ncbi:FkbM family methyltransferase [Chromatium okenii]|jgi:FkbM family methyltransferase|uniref:FkbM family methyltransferase n=1 Tax=Chromatium okenii TaxID=61644 RepID=UPI0026F28325|nr:FkbM family methyltransferase [Chromatium okenii]MBV5309734.1 FkbM family methyltransferase [Chromatium okenii]
MNASTHFLIIDDYIENNKLRSLCDEFVHGTSPKYIFGRNEYAVSVAESIEVDGFIDEYTKETEFLGKPIISLNDLPKNAVVVVVLGRPLTASKKLFKNGIRYIDYFSFQKYANLNILPVKFWNEFKLDFTENRDQYQLVFSLLQDEQSRLELTKLINFRLSNDLNYMDGFTDAQYRQYFEDFLALRPTAEVFVDVGGFDGLTSLEFIKRCPDYKGVHIFEPESGNMTIIKEKFSQLPCIMFYSHGLSNCTQTLRFSSKGSASHVSKEGELEIQVKRLDDVLHEPFTFLKMDIEGGETWAIEGAAQSIIKYHPRLAISVYHRFDDLWRIPQQILSYRNDYQIFLRHYTEGVDETVMFFIPQGSR